MYWKKASTAGAFVALVAGLGALVGLGPVQDMLGVADWLEENRIGSAHVGLATVALSMILMFLVSIMFPDPDRQPSPDNGERS